MDRQGWLIRGADKTLYLLSPGMRGAERWNGMGGSGTLERNGRERNAGTECGGPPLLSRGHLEVLVHLPFVGKAFTRQKAIPFHPNRFAIRLKASQQLGGQSISSKQICHSS